MAGTSIFSAVSMVRPASFILFVFRPDIVPHNPIAFLSVFPHGMFSVKKGFLSSCSFVKRPVRTSATNTGYPHSIPIMPHPIVIEFTFPSAFVVSNIPLLS